MTSKKRDDETLHDPAAGIPSASEHARARLAAAIEQASDAVAMTDECAIIKYVNPAFERTTGYSREEIVGKCLRDLEGGDCDESFLREKWLKLGRGEVWRGRVTNRRKNGELYEVDSSITPIRDPGNPADIVEYVAVDRDVTGEARLEKQLRRAQKMEALGTLAGGIAHELNNVLMPVIMNVEMIAEDLPEDSPLRVQVNLALGAAYRGRDLIRRILTFSRRKAEKKSVFNAAGIVDESLDLVRSVLPATVEIARKIQPDAGRILGDPTQIQELVLNLCNNAAQAMEGAKGRIEVAVRRANAREGEDLVRSGVLPGAGAYIEISVRDDGAGMDEQTLEKVFDPFFTTKSPGQGTGMGLAVVQGIVRAHGGVVEVRSAPGEGTLFRVYLPATAFEEKGRETETKVVIGGTERVMIVDDDESVAQTGRLFLEKLGYDVLSESSGARALESFVRESLGPDLVIADCDMPGMTGMELAEKLLQLRPGLPIIVYTGYSGGVDIEKVESLGITALVGKPVTTTEMAELVRRALDSRGK